jgi:hypothetical protein
MHPYLHTYRFSVHLGGKLVAYVIARGRDYGEARSQVQASIDIKAVVPDPNIPEINLVKE